MYVRPTATCNRSLLDFFSECKQSWNGFLWIDLSLSAGLPISNFSRPSISQV